jgi:hypothetical protein
MSNDSDVGDWLKVEMVSSVNEENEENEEDGDNDGSGDVSTSPTKANSTKS